MAHLDISFIAMFQQDKQTSFLLNYSDQLGMLYSPGAYFEKFTFIRKR